MSLHFIDMLKVFHKSYWIEISQIFLCSQQIYYTSTCMLDVYLFFGEECITIYLFSLAAALNSEIWALQKIFLTALGDNLSAFVQSQIGMGLSQIFPAQGRFGPDQPSPN